MTEGEAPKGLSAKLDKKRKRQAEESTKQDKPETAPAGASAGGDESNKKKRKKNKNKKQPEQDGKSQDRKGGIDESIGKMDGGLLADYFAQRAQKLDKELSAVELSDLSVPGMYKVSQISFHWLFGDTDWCRFCFPRHHIVFGLQNSGQASRFPQDIQPEDCQPF